MADVELSTLGSVIKTAYEGEADTNAFTDAEKTKLAGVEALADVTDATNVAAAGAHMSGGTDVPVADGGTGASTAAEARTNLGAGDVTKVGTPANNQIAVWTGDGTVEGDANLTWDGTALLINDGVLFLKEQAEADADQAGYGQLWVDTATPNVLTFTDDTGTDFKVSRHVRVIQKVDSVANPTLTIDASHDGLLIEPHGAGDPVIELPNDMLQDFEFHVMCDPSPLSLTFTPLSGAQIHSGFGDSAGSLVVNPRGYYRVKCRFNDTGTVAQYNIHWMGKATDGDALNAASALRSGPGSGATLTSGWVSGAGVTGSSPITAVVEQYGLGRSMSVLDSPTLTSDGAIQVVVNEDISRSAVQAANVPVVLGLRNLFVLDVDVDINDDWAANAALFRVNDFTAGYGAYITSQNVIAASGAGTTMGVEHALPRGRQRIAFYMDFAANPSTFRLLSLGRDENGLARVQYSLNSAWSAQSPDPSAQNSLDVTVGEHNLIAGRIGTHNFYGWRVIKDIPSGLTDDEIDGIMLTEMDKLGRDVDPALRKPPTMYPDLLTEVSGQVTTYDLGDGAATFDISKPRIQISGTAGASFDYTLPDGWKDRQEVIIEVLPGIATTFGAFTVEVKNEAALTVTSLQRGLSYEMRWNATDETWQRRRVTPMSLLVRTDSGSPSGVVTPDFVPQGYRDTNNDFKYEAKGEANTSWFLVGSGAGDTFTTSDDANTAITIGAAANTHKRLTSSSAITLTLSDTATVGTKQSVVKKGSGTVTAQVTGSSTYKLPGDTAGRTASFEIAGYGFFECVANSGGSAAEWDFIGESNHSETLDNDVDFGGNLAYGNLLRQGTRSDAGTALSTTDSGGDFVTGGALTIPNVAGWHADLEIGATTHDFTHNSITLDISAEGFAAGEIYSVRVRASNAIRVTGPAGQFTEADFA